MTPTSSVRRQRIDAALDRPWRVWTACTVVGYAIVGLIAYGDLAVRDDHPFRGLGTFIAVFFWTISVVVAAVVVAVVQRFGSTEWRRGLSLVIVVLSLIAHGSGLYMVWSTLFG